MINLVVALPAEARPLIDHFQLQGTSSPGNFRLYRGEDMTLILSGPGKTAAAAATALLGARSVSTPAAWLNIGIAGHASHAPGTGMLAHCITDQASGKRWYPPQILDLPIGSCAVVSVDTPEHRYPQDAAYDMECSGYIAIACRFSSAELVQTYKVISDNLEQPANALNPATCSQLITDRLEQIEQLVATLAVTAARVRQWHALPDELDALRQRWRFSTAQQHQLTELARRWQVLQPDTPLWLETLAQARSATAVLQGLQRHLDALPTGLTRNRV